MKKYQIFPINLAIEVEDDFSNDRTKRIGLLVRVTSAINLAIMEFEGSNETLAKYSPDVFVSS